MGILGVEDLLASVLVVVSLVAVFLVVVAVFLVVVFLVAVVVVVVAFVEVVVVEVVDDLVGAAARGGLFLYKKRVHFKIQKGLGDTRRKNADPTLLEAHPYKQGESC